MPAHIGKFCSAAFFAGNINHALAQTDGEFIAIFDADFVPPPSPNRWRYRPPAIIHGGGPLQSAGRAEAWRYMSTVHPTQRWGISAGVPSGWAVASPWCSSVTKRLKAVPAG